MQFLFMDYVPRCSKYYLKALQCSLQFPNLDYFYVIIFHTKKYVFLWFSSRHKTLNLYIT